MSVSDQVISVLNSLCEKFGIAFDWSQQNVIPYIQELIKKYITYEIATSIVWIVLLLSTTLATYKLVKYFFKKAKEANWDDYDPYSWGAIGAMTVFVLLCITSIIVISFQAFDIVTCITFPEKLIIEFIQTLMK